jgi:hypothetical protein
MNNRIYIFIIIIASVLFSCNPRKNGNKNDTVLARVYNKYLYESDIKDIVPNSSNAQDSLTIVKSYINNWIRQKLLVIQAEANLSDNQKNFSKQLEQYKNSLTIYTYESFLIQQNLDTVVKTSEIEQYYEDHKNSFQLKSNIVKVDYIKILNDSSHKKDLKDLLLLNKSKPSQSVVDSLQKMCGLYAEDFLINTDQWIYFDNLLKLIPITTYNQEAYLKNNTFIEIVDNSFQYYVNFLNFSIKDELSPIDFEKNNIRRLIRNRRKSELLNKMREDIFNQALEKKEIELF